MATLIVNDPDTIVNTGGGAGNYTFFAPVVVNESTKTITITPGSGILPLASDGITGQALYSAMKIVWKNSDTLIKYPFPMEAITPEQFDFINGWTLANDATRKSLRTCGWAEKDAGGATKRQYMGIVSLGNLDAADTSYYQWNTDIKTDFSFTGTLNEAIQIYGDVSNGNFDYSDGGDSLTLFNRIQGKLYSSATNTSIGATTLTYITYRFPLSNATDLKILATDAHVAYSDTITNAVWSGGSATYTVTSSAGLFVGSRVNITGMTPAGYNGVYEVKTKPLGTTFTVDLASDPGTYSAGGSVVSIHASITINLTDTSNVDVNDDTISEAYSTATINDASGVATTQEIYEKVAYLLRQPSPTDIDTGTGTVVGDTQPALIRFVGDTLVTEQGVFISNLSTAFLNAVQFYDDTNTLREYPFVSSGVINFGSQAGSGDFKYWMFYTTLPLEPAGSENNDYGQANARIVKDSTGTPIAGTFGGSPVPFSFKYTKEDANYGNGAERTTNVDAPVTVVGIGLSGGQFISVESTITRSTGQSILLAPAQERNYANP